MTSHAANLRLAFDLAYAQAVDESQQWVLTAMQKHGASLVMMLWRILGNEHDVCDAYQQTFLNLANYQQQDRRKPTNVQAFLYRTAANAAISMVRRKRRTEQSIETLTQTLPTEHTVDAGHDLDMQALQSRLRSAVAKLPDYLREVVVLHELAELSYGEVSDILGIPAATARVYRCKAITLLAAIMAGESKVIDD
ncbi:MAG: RNA polymerase sigma factor [Phycisphaerae bacterium]|nr:RNA polymerase sigma factor [Phycisphaerae bacterium]